MTFRVYWYLSRSFVDSKSLVTLVPDLTIVLKEEREEGRTIK